MGKYDQVLYNSERYYDSTAGQALLNVMREERKKAARVYDRKEAARVYDRIPEEPREESLSVKIQKFTAYQMRKHEAALYTETGKIKAIANPKKISLTIRMYDYCMRYCNESWFTAERAAALFHTSERKLSHVFNRRGNEGKIIADWLKNFMWEYDIDPADLLMEEKERKHGA